MIDTSSIDTGSKKVTSLGKKQTAISISGGSLMKGTGYMDL
jgi:hypothetical protein